jgi:hypothetical protein
MAKPSVSLVKEWEVVYDSDLVSVSVGTAVFDEDYWLLLNKATGKKKYFYGETAWSDSRRHASDLDFGALSVW